MIDTKVGRPIVVGVDGSDSAVRAVRWAAAEAARRQAPLRLVMASGWTDDPDPGPRGAGPHYHDILLDRSRRALADAVEIVRAEWPALAPAHELCPGNAIGVLIEQARAAQLLVVGDRGLNRVEGLLVGSVGVALAAHADCPVVVVRGTESDDPNRPVVVGVDGGVVSEAAIGFAFQAAADRSVPLVVVRTWWDHGLDQSPAVMFRDEEQRSAKEQLEQRLAGWSQKYPQVGVTSVVGRDRPAHLLLEWSRDAQLVVVGSRGHGELAGLVLGSVSNALVHRSDCPVAVVRPAPAQPS